MVLCLGEPLVRFLWCCCSSFYFWFSFLLFFFICRCSSFCCCSSFIFFFYVIPHSYMDYYCRGFYTPFYTFSPAHRRVIRDTFVFKYSINLAASATALSGNFLATWVFDLMFLHRHFNLRLSRLHWELAVLPWNLQGFILVLELHTRPICLFDSP